MLRAALLSLAMLATTWIEFRFFPGHTYLQGETQFYLPMLERLGSTGLLSRDLVAANPNLSLTVYDEVTLPLRYGAKLTFHKALLGQQWIFRLAALVGIYLLALACGMGRICALALSAIVSLGAFLAGPDIATADTEPAPSAFAFSLALLSLGFMARAKPLLAGLTGGFAFLYDPVIALPIWCMLFAGVVFQPALRKMFRSALPILMIFVLLLANLAQLQPAPAAEALLAKVSPTLAQFQHEHARFLWIADWPRTAIYQCLAIYVLSIWAAARVWPSFNQRVRWLILGTSTLGVLTIPLTYLLLDAGHLLWVARLRPARALVFTLALSALLFGVAALQAARRRYFWEATAWLALLLVFPLRFRAPKPEPIAFPQSLAQLAAWADSNTWGSSVFLFPDSGKSSDPAVFRAQSRHAIWTNWKDAEALATSEGPAVMWRERWRQTMEGGYSLRHLEKLLPLPIDYYVLRRQHELARVRTVFANHDFVAYDAQDLRDAPKPLSPR